MQYEVTIRSIYEEVHKVEAEDMDEVLKKTGELKYEARFDTTSGTPDRIESVIEELTNKS